MAENTAAATDATADMAKMILNNVEGLFGTLTDMLLDKVDGPVEEEEPKQMRTVLLSPAVSEDDEEKIENINLIKVDEEQREDRESRRHRSRSRGRAVDPSGRTRASSAVRRIAERSRSRGPNKAPPSSKSSIAKSNSGSQKRSARSKSRGRSNSRPRKDTSKGKSAARKNRKQQENPKKSLGINKSFSTVMREKKQKNKDKEDDTVIRPPSKMVMFATRLKSSSSKGSDKSEKAESKPEMKIETKFDTPAESKTGKDEVEEATNMAMHPTSPSSLVQIAAIRIIDSNVKSFEMKERKEPIAEVKQDIDEAKKPEATDAEMASIKKEEDEVAIKEEDAGADETLVHTEKEADAPKSKTKRTGFWRRNANKSAKNAKSLEQKNGQIVSDSTTEKSESKKSENAPTKRKFFSLLKKAKNTPPKEKETSNIDPPTGKEDQPKDHIVMYPSGSEEESLENVEVTLNGIEGDIVHHDKEHNKTPVAAVVKTEVPKATASKASASKASAFKPVVAQSKTPKMASPEPVVPKTAVSKATTTNAVVPKATASKTAVPKATATKAAVAKATAPKATVTKAAVTKAVAPKTTATKANVSKPAKPAAFKATAPKASASQTTSTKTSSTKNGMKKNTAAKEVASKVTAPKDPPSKSISTSKAKVTLGDLAKACANKALERKASQKMTLGSKMTPSESSVSKSDPPAQNSIKPQPPKTVMKKDFLSELLSDVERTESSEQQAAGDESITVDFDMGDKYAMPVPDPEGSSSSSSSASSESSISTASSSSGSLSEDHEATSEPAHETVQVRRKTTIQEGKPESKYQRMLRERREKQAQEEQRDPPPSSADAAKVDVQPELAIDANAVSSESVTPVVIVTEDGDQHVGKSHSILTISTGDDENWDKDQAAAAAASNSSDNTEVNVDAATSPKKMEVVEFIYRKPTKEAKWIQQMRDCDEDSIDLSAVDRYGVPELTAE